MFSGRDAPPDTVRLSVTNSMFGADNQPGIVNGGGA
jgi:hypothetical protein